MRADRLTSLKQRLRRGADAFEFNALIDGVSTLDEPEATPAPDPDPPADPPRNGAAATAVLEAVEEITVAAPVPGAPGGPVLEPLPAPAQSQPALDLVIQEPTPRQVATAHGERLRVALDSLGRRLTREAADMGAALRSSAIEEAGLHLAHANQILELLHSIDPSGEMARQLGSASAPPAGSTWPDTAWSVVEFARSPFSSLLPKDADDELVRSLLYSAWGVTFEPSPV